MSYNFSNNTPSREELEREQVRLLNEKEQNNRNGGKEDSRDRDRDRRRERNDRWNRDGEKDRRFDEDQRRFDNQRLRSPQQLMTQFEESFVHSATKHTGENGLIPVLRHLSILESHLGSLGSKAVGLLSEALYMEKSSQGSADVLVSREELFLETLREKLIGLLEVGFMDQTLSGVADIVVKKITSLLSIHKSGKSSGPSNERRTSFSFQSTSSRCKEPTVDMVDRKDLNIRGKRPKIRLTRGQQRRLKIEEAIAKGERVLTKKERRQVWEQKQIMSYRARTGVQGDLASNPHGEPSQTRKMTSGSQPESGVKRQRMHLIPENIGGMKMVESFADKVSVEKLAIVRLEHPDIRLTEDIAQSIKREIGRRALQGKDIRMSSCHLECGAVVVGCTNTSTKEWLEKQFKELNSFEGVQLRLCPARSLVKMVKVISFVPKTTGAKEKKDVMLGLKNQNSLNTDCWVVVGGKATSEGQYLVINIDEDSLQKLKALDMRPFLGCERVTFKLLGGKESS